MSERHYEAAGSSGVRAAMNTIRAIIDHAPVEVAELAEEITALEQRLDAARARKARLEELLAVAERPLINPQPRGGFRIIAGSRLEGSEQEEESARQGRAAAHRA